MRCRIKILLIIVLCLLLIIYALSRISNTKYDRGGFREIPHTVSSGETLWSISKQYCPSDMDIRQYIDLLEQTNSISASGYIYPGDKLILLTK